MLYFIHGDPNQIFEKASQMAESLLKKKPDATFFKIKQDNFSENQFEELLGGQGLFVNKFIISMSRLLEKSDIGDYLISKLKEIQGSENIFIWTEEKINKPILTKIEKNSAKVQEFQVKNQPIENKINVFAIADLFAQKNKKELWIKYLELLKNVPVEEIYGILWWQIKTLMLVNKTKTPAEAGMKDFLFKKNQKYCSNFTDGELQNIAFELIKLYHHSRLKGEGVDLNLEKFLLTY